MMYYVFVSVTLYAEFLPCKQRAKCVVLLDVSLVFSIAFIVINYIDFWLLHIITYK